MHPKEKIIALKCELRNTERSPASDKAHTAAGRQLQVFNLATKQKVGSHLMNDDVPFWTWISDTTLGLVTERDVQHWNVVGGESAPRKVSWQNVARVNNS
jgi:clathrin heavy chain